MRIFFLIALLVLSPCASARTVAPPIPIETKAVPLDSRQPDRALIGRLRYLGGIEIRSDDPRVGGFSSLKRLGGRFYAITDVGDWAAIDTFEERGRLVGASVASIDDLRGPDGAALEGTATGDAESLAHDGRAWLVSFEHEHKILRYKRLWEPAAPSGFDPGALFGGLGANNGVETLAARGGRLFLCAERLPSDVAPNCFIGRRGRLKPLSLSAPTLVLDPRMAFPVDADWARDGTLYLLMRSWSGGNDNRVAILSRSPRGELRTLATFVPPVTTDNYEGLAVREEKGRTFLYMISDDNFRQYNEPGRPETWQRTLLMKFEVIG